MSAQSDNYIAKRKEFEQAQKDRDQIIGKVVAVAAGLQSHPDKFNFSNIPGGFPPEVIMNRASPSVDGNRWPTATEIQNALVQWHQSRQAMFNAWEAIPREDRSAFQPPR